MVSIVKGSVIYRNLQKYSLKMFFSVCLCHRCAVFSQTADRSGGASLGGGGESEPGAEAQRRDQCCQTGGAEAEGAPGGNRK